MHQPFVRPASFVFCCALILALPSKSNSQERSEPQLVRVTYAQGEVKFSPGSNGKPLLESDWLKAFSGLTPEEGYTLATEDGRAIIEFENGSVVYLAEHSTLQFKRLQTKGPATISKLQLLTGTATISYLDHGHDQMVITTPTAKMTMKSKQTVRMDSTLNGTIVRPLDNPMPLNEPGRPHSELKPGEAVAFVDGFRYELKGPMARPESDAWDKWVNAQLLQHAAEIKKGLQESGLKEPIPGLAQLVETGHFFDCPPYGKCWEPNSTPVTKAPAVQTPSGAAAAAAPIPNAPRNFVINRTLLNRCPMETWVYSVGRPSRLGLLAANEPEETFTVSGFPWSGCFAGSWLMDSCWDTGFYGGFPTFGVWGFAGYPRYCGQAGLVYVVGHRHKRPPCHIVHTHHGWGVVPRHPFDHRGQPPVNAKHGIFVLAVEKNNVQAKFDSAPGKDLHWETSLPREFAQERFLMTSTEKVTPPVIQGKMLEVGSHFGHLTVTPSSNELDKDIRYDYQSKSFVATRSWTSSGAGRTAGSPIVVAHVGSNGVSGVVSHAGGGWLGGSGGGGHAGFGGSAGGSSGGHAGGGSSGGGGGGGHAGGGSFGGSSGGGAASSGGAAAGGGGGHH